jgi:rhodanese-related sulfurtransferase
VLTQIVNRFRLVEPANATRLDVDDPTAPEREHVLGAVNVRDRFIETDRRRNPVLQLRVPSEVVLPERLLDHHQPERIEVGEMRRVFQCLDGS